MLRGSLAFIVLVVCAVIGAELQRQLARRGWRAPTMEGISFLGAGVVLGGAGLGLFPEDILATLRVVVLFGLAWIGLVVGVQMDRRAIRRIAVPMRWIGILAPSLAAVALAAAAVASGQAWSLALATAAIAVASSPAQLESAVRGVSVAPAHTIRVLRLLLAFAGIPAVASMAVATSVASPLVAEPHGLLSGPELLAMVVAIGVAVGYALVVLVRGVREPVQLLTLTIGGMCTLAGATAAVGVNALPAAACAGAVVVNRAVFPHGMLRVAHSLARPLLVALLVLVGASWHGASFSWPVFALMTVGRAAVLLAVGAVVARVGRAVGSGRLSMDLGLGLLPQGELALGLLVAVVAFTPSATGFLEAVVAAVVVNNLAGARWIANRVTAADSPGASA